MGYLSQCGTVVPLEIVLLKKVAGTFGGVVQLLGWCSCWAGGSVWTAGWWWWSVLSLLRTFLITSNVWSPGWGGGSRLLPVGSGGSPLLLHLQHCPQRHQRWEPAGEPEERTDQTFRFWLRSLHQRHWLYWYGRWVWTSWKISHQISTQ